MVKLSIIILSWNTEKLLRDCLRSLIQDTRYKIQDTEIIVVDNGSTDGSREYLKSQISNLKVIFNKENLGFAKGNNQALRQAFGPSSGRGAQGRYVMLLNSDTVVKKGALEKLVEFLDKNPQVAAVSPLLLNPDGSPQIDYYMKFPNLWQIFLYHNPILRPVVMKTPLKWLVVSRGDGGKGFEVDQLPGAALMARREVWDKVGFLDEDYHFLFEDVDWCWRAKKAGYKLMVIPQAKIVHIGGASWKKKVKESSFEFYRQFFSSMLLFVKKNYGKVRLLIFRMALVVHLLITFKPRLAFWFMKITDFSTRKTDPFGFILKEHGNSIHFGFGTGFTAD